MSSDENSRLTPITPEEEQFFTAMALQHGRPKPLQELRAQRGGKKAPIAQLQIIAPDVHFIVQFSSLAASFGITCADENEFRALYHRYEFWYGANIARHQT